MGIGKLTNFGKYLAISWKQHKIGPWLLYESLTGSQRYATISDNSDDLE